MCLNNTHYSEEHGENEPQEKEQGKYCQVPITSFTLKKKKNEKENLGLS